MPLRVLIIGLLFCLAGLSAIWQVIADLFHDHLNINLAVFLLPVGVGLLRGRLSSRGWAGFWIFLGIAGCALLIVGALLHPGQINVSWFDRGIRGRAAVPYAIVIATVMALLLYLVRRLLHSPKASAYFQLKSGDGMPTGAGWFPP